MITAEKLKTLTSYSADQLGQIIQDSGYHGDTFASAKFLGITTGGQFCYRVTYPDGAEQRFTKVFVDYDTVADRTVADY